MRLAVGMPHGSPKLDGTESEETREGVQTRAIAFWGTIHLSMTA